MLAFQPKIKGGASRARRDGKNHSGGRAATQTQLDYLRDLGWTKPTDGMTRLEASDAITILQRRRDG